MKKRTKLALGGVVALFGVIALSSCTQSFCNNTDTARAIYAFDPGITRYKAGGSNEITSSLTIGGETYTYNVKNVDIIVASFDNEKHEFYFSEKDKLTYLNNVISDGWKNGIVSISDYHVDYFKKMDSYVLDDILKAALERDRKNITYDFNDSDVSVRDANIAKFNRDVSYFSYLKFTKSDSEGIWTAWDKYHTTLVEELGADYCPSSDFVRAYKSAMSSNAASYRTCLATNTDKYGSYGYSTDGIYVTEKTWGYAWSKGFFEGLLVYPIGWLIDQIANGFGFIGNPGVSALLAIFFVTLIVRSIMMLFSIKQTTGNAKMTELQPEITKIQNKYPNAQTNQYEKQRMAQEMNDLYKKNNIKPLSSIIVLIVQFPIFICVWGALSGASVLTNGSFLGLKLSDSISAVLFNGASWGVNAAGFIPGLTALFLFLLMAAAQTVAMLLPQWMQKARAKKVAKLGKNPSQQSQQNKMKWVTYIMLALIIFMGFSLVSAMGVYWFVGAVISIGQTLITQAITSRKKKEKKGNR